MSQPRAMHAKEDVRIMAGLMDKKKSSFHDLIRTVV
jgi:hypothetical protein